MRVGVGVGVYLFSYLSIYLFYFSKTKRWYNMSVVWIGNGFSNENMKGQETKMKKSKK